MKPPNLVPLPPSAVRRLHRAVYIVVAGLCVLFAARAFYGELLDQTGGEWSAPLDDVFIHFDYARATARGYPFQWSEGNGYSSGNTSITYPFVLALGYWAGFRSQHLMLWAAIVATCSVLAYLLVVRRLARRLPGLVRLMLPVAVLSVGALDWTLFSGMEVAFFLAVWAVALSLTLDHENAASTRLPALGWALGLAGALTVATRPEAATSVAVLGFAAGWFVLRRGTWGRAARTVLRAGAPAVAFLLLQAAVNKVLTGHSAAAGALVKLGMYNPYMTVQEKWDTYLFHLRYCALRNLHHHFTDGPGVWWELIYGWIPVALAVVALISPRTRRYAVILVASAVLFTVLVATNGQVRWQNERYTMPAVAWLLTAAGLGLGVLLSPAKGLMRWPRWTASAAIGLTAAGLFWVHQKPRMVDQIWFFGRASRNIRDQHITAGRLLRHHMSPVPQRVLVGDAGAIMYSSDLPGLDIIGLGGFRGLPFARSSVHGLGATVELLERIPAVDLPDILAIYPTWWGTFPLWFGEYITSVGVEGNVICGGAHKAIYRADWHLLGTGSRPTSLRPGEKLVDELDVADLISEERHAYAFPRPSGGWVDMRVLSDEATRRDLLDSGRRIPEGRSEVFELICEAHCEKLRLVFRTAPARAGAVEVVVDDVSAGHVRLEESASWKEHSLSLRSGWQPGRRYKVGLTPSGSDWVNYHVWLVAEP